MTYNREDKNVTSLTLSISEICDEKNPYKDKENKPVNNLHYQMLEQQVQNIYKHKENKGYQLNVCK